MPRLPSNDEPSTLSLTGVGGAMILCTAEVGFSIWSFVIVSTLVCGEGRDFRLFNLPCIFVVFCLPFPLHCCCCCSVLTLSCSSLSFRVQRSPHYGSGLTASCSTFKRRPDVLAGRGNCGARSSGQRPSTGLLRLEAASTGENKVRTSRG